MVISRKKRYLFIGKQNLKMPGSMSELAARMDQRKQRLLEEQQHLDRVN